MNSNTARRPKSLAEQQSDRLRRAEEQLPFYRVTLERVTWTDKRTGKQHSEAVPTVRLRQPRKPGEAVPTYTVTRFGCNCPDALKAREAGIRRCCKHELMSDLYCARFLFTAETSRGVGSLMDTLTDDLPAAVAREVLGWRREDHLAYRDGFVWRNEGKRVWPNKWNPLGNPADLRLVQDRMRDGPNAREFCRLLRIAVQNRFGLGYDPDTAWLHATPEEVCRAALETVRAGKERTG